MMHSKQGKNLELAAVPPLARRKAFHENMELADGLHFTSRHGFAQLAAFTDNVDFTAVPFTERNKPSSTGQGQAVHFFLDDYRFRDAVWKRLEATTYSIRKFDYYFTPDLSLWWNAPTEFYNIQNIYRTRFIGAYWQKCGYAVIPTASFGGCSSFAYCFEGLPEESVIAVSGMGNRRDSAAYYRWRFGLKRLEEEKHPLLIIVYGEEVEVPGLHTPLKFIPDFISTHLRNDRD